MGKPRIEETVDQSLTASTRQYLDTFIDEEVITSTEAGDLTTMMERAARTGLTLRNYVLMHPDKAVKEAEAILAEWLGVQTTAAIEGKIKTENGEFVINKNTTKLIELRVQAAQAQLDKVNDIAMFGPVNGERRREQLIRALYQRAVDKGDTRAAVYLIDRIEGRPGEARVADLDYDNAFNAYQIIHSLFDKQLEVLNSGVGTKMLCCSRRSGKSHLLAASLLLASMSKPNTNCIYVGETAEHSEQILNGAIEEIVTKCQLRDKRGKRFNWRKMDNGSTILVRGLSSTKDPDQIRGFKAKVVAVDEFFHLKSELLEYLVREVLQPMQMDYAGDYQFICVGTPPSIKGTYGEHAWRTWECPHFFWTFRDNPYPTDVAAREQYVEDVLKEKGLDWTSTFARREYGGEWVYDDDLLLYPEYHTYNVREAVPQWNIDMVYIGIDYGVSDNDTLIGVAWDSAGRRGYEFHADKFNRLDIKDRTISQLEYLRGQVVYAWEEALQFFPHLEAKEANKRILWDADDNMQHITDDFNMNIRLPNYPELRLNIMNAHKTDKVMMMDKIRDLLRTGNLLLMEGSKTCQECEQTVLKRGPGGQVYPEVDSKVFHPDLLPALRYAMWNAVGQESAPKEV